MAACCPVYDWYDLVLDFLVAPKSAAALYYLYLRTFTFTQKQMSS